MMNARWLLLCSLALFFNRTSAQQQQETHTLCLQLSLSPMSTSASNGNSARSYYFAEIGAHKREQHNNVFSQYGFLFTNGMFNGDARPVFDSLQIYRSVGPVIGFGYQPEHLIAGFDISGGIGLPLRVSDVHDASFNFSVKAFLNVSYHAQFFLRFSNITTVFGESQSIRQGGLGIQVLIY
jgi:hypothetical protein